jgi:uncharacterized membrane protein (UPF0127 family)
MRSILLTYMMVVLLGVTPQARVGIAEPVSRTARDVWVFWQTDANVRRLAVPGRHELRFPCTQVPGAEEQVVLRISRVPEAVPDSSAPRACSPQEAVQLAREGASAAVVFTDAVSETLELPDTGQELAVPNGGSVLISVAFAAEAGMVCCVPAAPAATAELARAVVVGDEITVTGRPLVLADGRPGLLATGLHMGRPLPVRDEPPWRVAVYSAGTEVLNTTADGRHPLTMPCSHREGAAEQMVIFLREFPAVEIGANGKRITAELAATQATRTWGLQGRPGLEADEGMLFYWSEPFRATFVMKTVSFPLSIAFIRADGTVVNIERLNPGDTHGVTALEPVPFVLETEQGWFAANGIAPGSRLSIP